ncbi:unnamed protein product [Schistosoma margrebowiei]|uniref:Uncharacterized protein n=1 Tax=Schistosoma margrebowiei TaxID=48269 RepID=A0A183N612_9TREM|nr:unnamed protein product [Schistosoma margrebowiei]
MSFKPNLKSNYGNVNPNLETQTKVINFFNTYKQLLDGYTRHVINKLHNTTSSINSNINCNSNIGNNIVEFMNYDSLQDHQIITNTEPNNVGTFKSPIISSYKNVKLKPYSSTSNLINSTSKYPCFNDFCLTANNSQYKSNDFIKDYSQTLSCFPLSNWDYFKTQHYPSVNSHSQLSISGMNERIFKKVQPSTTLSLFSPSSSVISLSNKLSTSPLTTSTNTTAISSNSSSPSLSVDSMDIKTNIPKHLTVQKILKRLAKLPNNLGPYICRLCNQYFENALKLANHRCPLILHTDYRCPECDKVFNCPANLASHRRWHKPKSEINYDQIPIRDHSLISTLNNDKYFIERKYSNHNSKKLITNTKLFNKNLHLNNLPKNQLNSIVFHHNQKNQLMIHSNKIKKPTFTVQAILDNSVNNDDKIHDHITTTTTRKSLNFDKTIINIESSKSINFIESNKINLNFSNNNLSINDNDNNNNHNHTTINNSTNIKEALMNQPISLKCNYCNTLLSTHNELETHMVEHIFNRIKSKLEGTH